MSETITKVDPMKCDCLTWGRDRHPFGNGHHYNCPHFVPTRLKIWAINDCEWVMAETLAEAAKIASDLSGVDVDDLLGDDAHALTEEDLHRLTFNDDDGETRRTFAEEFARRLAADGDKPRYFASTEF
jgi:hypothetical protein